MGNDYVVLSLEKEYPGYTGTEKWMIITDLPREEFAEKHPDQISLLDSSVIMSVAMGVELLRYKNNEAKHGMRSKRKEVRIDAEALSIADERVSSHFSNLWLMNAIDSLPQLQRDRIIKNYVYGFSAETIAEFEGVNISSVQRSLRKGVANLRRYCELNPIDKKEEVND